MLTLTLTPTLILTQTLTNPNPLQEAHRGPARQAGLDLARTKLCPTTSLIPTSLIPTYLIPTSLNLPLHPFTSHNPSPASASAIEFEVDFGADPRLAVVFERGYEVQLLRP